MYYFIDEEAARRAKEMNSFSDYQPGSAAEEYRREVDKASAIAAEQKRKVDPIHHEWIDYLLDLYARKLAENMNEANRIDACVPSVLVSGAGNFPTRKKEKQNRARDANMEQRCEVQKIPDKIRGAGTAGISSDDPAAVQKLKLKLERLQDEQETMKAVNAFYRKNGTPDGCPHIPPEAIEKLKAEMARSYRSKPKPYESFMPTNNGAEIRRAQARIEELTRQASTEHAGWEFNGGHAEINREANRLQLFFDGKLDADTRASLKHGGFRWAPSAGAWQRQLNDRAFYAADHLECIRPLSGELPSALQRRVQSEQAAPASTSPRSPEQEPESSESLPDEAAQPEADEITPEMIAEGLSNGSVRIVDSPHGDGAVCLPETPFETWDNPWFDCATAGGIAAKLCGILRDSGEKIPTEGFARMELIAKTVSELLTPNENILEWRLIDLMKKPGLPENLRTRAGNLAREIGRYKARHGIEARARTSNCKKRKPPQC